MTDVATEARVRWLEQQVAELTEQVGIARMHGRLLAEEVRAWTAHGDEHEKFDGDTGKTWERLSAAMTATHENGSATYFDSHG
jgi:hypothetical protein